MSEIIEKVAKVIAATTYAGGHAVWDTLSDQERGVFIDAARGSLEAMREPTEGMIERGSDARQPGNSRWGNSLKTWQHMIDAALSQPK